MTQHIVRDSTLIQGVSQQAEDLRGPGQVTESVNSWMSPVEGLGKRQGTKYLSNISDDPYTDALIHGIDRDGQEKYTALITQDTVKVASLLGTDHTLLGNKNLIGDSDEASDFFPTGVVVGTVPEDWMYAEVPEPFDPISRKDAIADPDGTMKADLIGFDSVATTSPLETAITRAVSTDGTVDNQEILVRVKIKRKDSDQDLHIKIQDGSLVGDIDVAVDWATPSVVIDSNTVSGRTLITALSDDWYLLEYVYARGGTVSGQLITMFLYPSVTDLTTAPVDGTGGVYLYNMEVIGLETPDMSYLDITEPNLLGSPESLSATDWTYDGNMAAVVSSSATGPYGLDTYATLERNTAVTTGTVSQAKDEFHAGPQMFSCVFRASSTNPIDRVTLRLADTTTAVNHDVDFNWTAGVPLTGTATAGVLKYGIKDLNHGNYELWMSVDPAHTSLTASGASRSVGIILYDADTSELKQIDAWGARLTNGVDNIKDYPYQDALKSIDAITVQDSTFVSNARVTPALSTSKASGDDATEEAYIFVQQAAYDANYRVSVAKGNEVTTGYTDVVSSIDTDKALYDSWEFSILTPGDIGGGNWTVVIAGVGVSWSPEYSNQGYHLEATARKGVREINRLMEANGKNIVATSTGGTIFVRSTIITVNNTFTHTATPTGGSVLGTSPLNVITGAANGLTVRQANTSVIAANLASQLEVTGITAEVSGSVVKLVSTDGIPFTTVTASDSAGDQYMQAIFEKVDFIDKLPVTCREGYKVLVAGDASSGADDYYLVFKADNGAEFGKGVWLESIAAGTLDQLDGATMPHRLVRRQDNSVGSWTGVSNSIFFTWEQVEWSKAKVGDPNLNPAPSFVGSPITALTYWKSRLCFTAGSNLIASEVSRFENFWRTTVRDLVDSDPIDISAGTKDVAVFNHTALTDQRLFLFSDLDVYELSGSPLTPKTAELIKRLRVRNSERCEPMSMGSNVLMAYENSQYTNIKEMFQVDEDLFDTSELSAVCPSYILGKPRSIAVSTVEDVSIVLSEGDRGTAYVYKHFNNGRERVQSAWSKWTFGTNTSILGVVFIQSEAIFYLERDGGVYLESMALGDGLVDPGATYTTRLDQAIRSDHPGIVSAVYSAPNTTFTLPAVYDLDASESYEVWTAPGDSSGAGQNIPVVSSTASTVVVAGDFTSREVVIGQKFTQLVTLSKPLRKDQGADGRSTYLDGRVQALRAHVAFEGAAEFSVITKAGDRTGKSQKYNKGINSGSGLTLMDGSLSVPLQTNARDLTVQLQNDDATPANFLSVEYLVEHNPRA